MFLATGPYLWTELPEETRLSQNLTKGGTHFKIQKLEHTVRSHGLLKLSL